MMKSIALQLFLASFTTNIFVASESADEYHARLEGLLESVFENQTESTAWWVGFAHPTHGDHYWVFGNSSDTDETIPPDIPATIDDHFYIGSISKTFGATVNLQLIEQGHFALNQTIESIIPDFALEFPQYANYTPADMMGMQTLVPDFLNDPNGIARDMMEDPDKRYSIFEIIESAMTRYPATFPEEYTEVGVTIEDFGLKEYYEYSTTNILAMEYLAENVTGRTMQELVQDLALTPLGLNNTAEPLRDAAAGDIPEPAVKSYIGAGCVKEFAEYGTNLTIGYRNDAFMDSIVSVGTGGNMYSSITDLLQWSKSGVGDSLLLPETVAARHVFHPTSLLLQYGLGMHEHAVLPEYGSGWYGHDGDAFGSNARAVKSDELDAAFASAINTCGTEELHSKGFNILVGDLMSADNSTSSSESPNATSADTGTMGDSDDSKSEGSGLLHSTTLIHAVTSLLLLFV